MIKSTDPDEQPGQDPAVLPIGEVSRRTGIPAAGLRNWEQRYGLPRPQRSATGHRLYRESDCTLLAEVLRGRARGLSVPAAIAHATAGAQVGEQSVFAGLRRRHPELRAHVMAKHMLLALTRAIEDECCARAQRAILAGCFQRQRFYQASRRRWADLARGAEHTLVFADFTGGRQQPGPLVEVPVAAGSPMLREWALVCDAPDHPACVAGWEHPGQDQDRDADRIFEVVWSVDPPVVRSAARITAGLAAAAGFATPPGLHTRLGEQAPASSEDLRRASGLLERTLDYLTR
jgi:MerR family transcriptional regulator, light-induced transcriptional regulator